jgi:acetyl-CoA/propionyl-CoA carboxylase biotin carboxyl carrier protein
MLAKLIAWGDTRETARRRAVEALRSYPILGVRTNVPFLIALLEHPAFVSGDIDTGFVDVERGALVAHLGGEPPPEALAVAHAGETGSLYPSQSIGAPDPWTTLRGWRG